MYGNEKIIRVVRKIKKCGKYEKKDKKNKGFSLVEVVVSMAILSIITLTLLNYFGNSARYNSEMSRNQKATLSAQAIMEELKAQDTLIQKKSGTEEYTVPYLLDKNFVVDENTLNTEDFSTGKIKGVGKIRLIGKAEDTGKNYDEVVTVSTSVKAQDKSIKKCGYDNSNSAMSVDGGQDDEAVAHFKMIYMDECEKNNMTAAFDNDDIKERMQREIVIEIDNKVEEADIINVRYRYSYNAKSGDKPLFMASDYELYVVKNQMVFRNDKKINLYLLYHSFNENDSLSVSKTNKTTAFDTKYGFHLLCQNEKPEGNNIKVSILDKETILDNMIYTNIEKSNIIGVSTEIYKEEDGLKLSSVNMVDLTVSVYEKGKAEEKGAKPYLTISGTKGEKP